MKIKNKIFKIFIKTFFKIILSLENEKKINSALDHIFDIIEDLCIDNKLNFIDNLFLDKRIDDLDINLQIGFLTITLPWKDSFKNRTFLYCKVYQKLYLKYNDIKKVELVLSKLK